MQHSVNLERTEFSQLYDRVDSMNHPPWDVSFDDLNRIYDAKFKGYEKKQLRNKEQELIESLKSRSLRVSEQKAKL